MISFSVIIPNYNHSLFLQQRLDSVLHQTYPGIEVIILDDCSSDNSRNIIETFRSHNKISQIVYNEKNSGSPFLQWKKGIELAKGDWIWIAETDDFADPGFLEVAARAIREFPLLGIFYSDSYIVNENNENSPEKFSTRKNKIFQTLKWDHPYYTRGIDELNDCLKFDCTINNISSAVIRKNLFLQNITTLDEFIYYGDWISLIKASLLCDVYYSPEPLNYYRQHRDSHLNRETSVVISRLEYFKILKELYYNESITGKNNLLNHFAYNYLSFGVNGDGIKKSRQIILSYFKTDSRLAWKILMKIIAIKVFRKKQPFFVTEKNHTDQV